jgi:hypothetical protein
LGIGQVAGAWKQESAAAASTDPPNQAEPGGGALDDAVDGHVEHHHQRPGENRQQGHHGAEAEELHHHVGEIGSAGAENVGRRQRRRIRITRVEHVPGRKRRDRKRQHAQKRKAGDRLGLSPQEGCYREANGSAVIIRRNAFRHKSRPATNSKGIMAARKVRPW